MPAPRWIKLGIILLLAILSAVFIYIFKYKPMWLERLYNYIRERLEDNSPVCTSDFSEGESRLLDLRSLNYNINWEDLREMDLESFRSKGEKICAQTLMTLFDVPFITVRPDWLKNPETGRNLELDCYNEQLRLAVEYNGQQHYQAGIYGDKAKLKSQQLRDRLKQTLCATNGILLIIVPYTIKHRDIPKYICQNIPQPFRNTTVRVTGRPKYLS